MMLIFIIMLIIFTGLMYTDVALGKKDISVGTCLLIVIAAVLGYFFYEILPCP